MKKSYYEKIANMKNSSYEKIASMKNSQYEEITNMKKQVVWTNSQYDINKVKENKSRLRIKCTKACRKNWQSRIKINLKKNRSQEAVRKIKEIHKKSPE